MEELSAMTDAGSYDVAQNSSDARLFIRPALPEDAADILNWRNDPLVRAMSRHHEPIAEAAHMTWYSQAVHDPKRLLLVGEYAGKKIGIVRFDQCEAALWEVSITVSAEARGRGIGKQLLEMALSRLFCACSGISVLAFARLDNEPSLRLFHALGFNRIGDDGMLAKLVLPSPLQASRR